LQSVPVDVQRLLNLTYRFGNFLCEHYTSDLPKHVTSG
jgi:hypothetical protein